MERDPVNGSYASLDQMIGWYASPAVIPSLLAAARRQAAKDRLFLARIQRHFRPGSVLEIGAGVGQLSQLLARMGFDVVASDIHPHLVEFMRSRGLKAEVVDARQIHEAIRGPFDNVFTSGLHTLLTKDLEGAEDTYISAFKVLRPGGRFLIVLGNGYKPRRWATPDMHAPLIRRSGFRLVKRFRDQVLPSTQYSRLPAWLFNALEFSIGRFLGVRNVLVIEKPIAS